MKKISNIRSPLIDNFIKIIKKLADRGRNSYQTYLVHPLSKWSHVVPTESMDELKTMLIEAEKNTDLKLPLIYKLALVKSVAPDQLDLSVTGNVSINFLKAMKNYLFVTKSEEAIEFINVLRDPFKEYSENEFKRMNKRFAHEINTTESVEINKLVHAIEKSKETAYQILKLSRKAITEIEQSINILPIGEVKKAIIKFLLKFSDPSEPDRHLIINSVFDKISSDNNQFKKDVMYSTAVVIYHEILKAIMEKKLDRAVKYIGKYTVIFRGDPDTPNYYEVDTFEKKFFEIIEERNLWDIL